MESRSFLGSSAGKELACNVGDLGSIPGLGRSPEGGNSYPLQYSCLENSMDRGAWEVTVHGVAKSQTQLSNFHFHSATQIGGKPLLVEPLGTAGPRGQHLHDPQCLGGDDSEGYS